MNTKGYICPNCGKNLVQSRNNLSIYICLTCLTTWDESDAMKQTSFDDEPAAVETTWYNHKCFDENLSCHRVTHYLSDEFNHDDIMG